MIVFFAILFHLVLTPDWAGHGLLAGGGDWPFFPAIDADLPQELRREIRRLRSRCS
jgi:hypothetical protein